MQVGLPIYLQPSNFVIYRIPGIILNGLVVRLFQQVKVTILNGSHIRETTINRTRPPS
jgi:hypothetical protein